MSAFIGIDLAWTDHRESGICVLEGDASRLQCSRLDSAVTSTAELTRLAESFGPETFVAVDAPLIIGEARMAERQLGRVFGRFKAGAYLATPSFLAKMGGMAGPRLGEALRAAGFSLDPASVHAGVQRVAMEVYPHAAHVVLFSLSERIKYKKGVLSERRAGLLAFQSYLSALFEPHPAVLSEPCVAEVLSQIAVGARGQQLKRLEDRLDALTCAYVAYHAWNGAPATSRVFGDTESGYILVPWRDGFA